MTRYRFCVAIFYLHYYIEKGTGYQANLISESHAIWPGAICAAIKMQSRILCEIRAPISALGFIHSCHIPSWEVEGEWMRAQRVDREKLTELSDHPSVCLLSLRLLKFCHFVESFYTSGGALRYFPSLRLSLFTALL
ncbi:hypothetical protein J6590_005250 [Homalodisca vitripennis]|nr:hypothetical protein J6590_005250 [Homalodisca vitripennis]